MSEFQFLFVWVLILSSAQMATVYCTMKYAQTVNKQVELNTEYVGRLLKFIDKVLEKHPELAEQNQRR